MQVASLDEARALLVSDDELQDAGPRIHLIGDRNVLGDRRIQPSFRLSEAGYALVVAVDLDRNVQVIYPETPAGAARLVQPETSYKTMRFFAGWGRANADPAFARFASFTPAFERIDAFNGGGVLIGIASDRPLDVARLSDGDEWDEGAIEDLIFGSTVASAARRIGQEVVAPGQHFTTDVSYLRDPSVSTFGLASLRATDRCSDFNSVSSRGGYGVNWALGVHGYVTAHYVIGNQYFVRIANDDGCGNITYVDVPEGRPVPRMPRDTTKADSAQAPPSMQRRALDDVRRARIERLRDTRERQGERAQDQRRAELLQRAESQQRTESQQRAHEAQMRQALERRMVEERRATSADRREERMEPTRVDVGGGAGKAEPSRPVSEP